MKRIFLIVALISSCFVSQVAFADGVDPLWRKTVEKIKEGEKYVPRDIEQTLDLEKDDVSKRVMMKLQLTDWKKEDPLYTVVSSDPLPKDSRAVKPLNFDSMLKASLRKIFSENTPAKRVDGIVFNGVTATAFEVVTGSLQKIKATVWVHPESGQVYRYRLAAYFPMTFDIDMMVTFSDNPAGMRLATKREMDVKILIPFKKAKAHISETFANWLVRVETNS